MNQHPKSIQLHALLAEAGIHIPPSLSSALTVSGLASDSRLVRAGDLFVAIPGLHTDARDYIPVAMAKGAIAVVTEAEGDSSIAADIPIISVPNARVALARLYDAWYNHPARRLRLVGVTGTNGKTSVSTMLRHILRAAGIPCGLIGTVGCFTPMGDASICGGTDGHDALAVSGMTTPEPATLYALLHRMAEDVAADASDEAKPVVIMEVTSHALWFGRVAPLTFETSIFTNLTPEHLDLHGTMEAYFAVKRRLFEVSRRAVVNADDRYGRLLLSEPLPVGHWYICHAADMAGIPPDRMCPAGDGGCTRVYAEQVKHLGEDGVAFKLTTPDVRVRVRCPVPGEFTVMNAMQAAAAALSLGVPPSVIRSAIASFPGVPGRMEVIARPDAKFPATVVIDFAHTPDALEQVLATTHAARRRGQRIVLLFGCGGDRDRSKRKVMARIASRMADSVIITSDNSRSERPADIISDILAGMDKESEFAVVPDRAEAIRYAIRNARMGDIILLCGKGHETYEITAEGKHPFSEKTIVAEAICEFWKQA